MEFSLRTSSKKITQALSRQAGGRLLAAWCGGHVGSHLSLAGLWADVEGGDDWMAGKSRHSMASKWENTSDELWFFSFNVFLAILSSGNLRVYYGKWLVCGWFTRKMGWVFHGNVRSPEGEVNLGRAPCWGPIQHLDWRTLSEKVI